MKNRLYLLRHAKAEWARPGMEDFDRPLKESGHLDAANMGRIMLEARYMPKMVLCSQAKRAVETWDSLSAMLDGDCLVNFTDRLYGTDSAGYLRLLQEAGDHDSVMLIGHNPMIEDVAFALAGDGEPSAMSNLERGFPTTGLAVLSFGDSLRNAAPGKARLEAFIRPSELEAE